MLQPVFHPEHYCPICGEKLPAIASDWCPVARRWLDEDDCRRGSDKHTAMPWPIVVHSMQDHVCSIKSLAGIDGAGNRDTVLVWTPNLQTRLKDGFELISDDEIEDPPEPCYLQGGTIPAVRPAATKHSLPRKTSKPRTQSVARQSADFRPKTASNRSNATAPSTARPVVETSRRDTGESILHDRNQPESAVPENTSPCRDTVTFAEYLKQVASVVSGITFEQALQMYHEKSLVPYKVLPESTASPVVIEEEIKPETLMSADEFPNDRKEPETFKVEMADCPDDPLSTPATSTVCRPNVSNADQEIVVPDLPASIDPYSREYFKEQSDSRLMGRQDFIRNALGFDRELSAGEILQLLPRIQELSREWMALVSQVMRDGVTVPDDVRKDYQDIQNILKSK